LDEANCSWPCKNRCAHLPRQITVRDPRGRGHEADLESGDKGKYGLVIVAIIGAIATISVPIVSHYFPSSKPDDHVSTSPVQSPSIVPQDTQKVVEPQPKSAVPETAPIAPPSGEDGALNLLNVNLHIAAKDYAAAYRTASYLVNAKPDDPRFHACLADLSVSQGLMSKAADEFKLAADHGLDGMDVRAARVKENLPVLKAGYLYVSGTEYGHDSAVLFGDLYKAGIPGTLPFREKLCADAKKTLDYQNANYAPERRMYAPKGANDICTSDPGRAVDFIDCTE